MDNLEKYFDKAKDMAGDAGDKAKSIAGDVVSEAKEKVQSIMLGSGAAKEIRLGIEQLEALPEFDGSILYKMELEAAASYLRSLLYIIEDDRIDKDSVAEEVRKVLAKVQPDSQASETEEQQAIENVKSIVCSACTKALETL